MICDQVLFIIKVWRDKYTFLPSDLNSHLGEVVSQPSVGFFGVWLLVVCVYIGISKKHVLIITRKRNSGTLLSAGGLALQFLFLLWSYI